MQVKSILVHVGLEGNTSAAVNMAARLAARHKAAVTLISVVEHVSRLSRLFMPESVTHWGDIVQKEAGDRLNKHAEELGAKGIEAYTSVLTGKPSLEAVREVLRNGHDLVIKDVDPDTNDPSSPIGGVDMRLLRKCPVPVWLVRSDRKPGIQRVLASIDPEPDDPEGEALNRKIFKAAAEIAEEHGSEIHAVRAWDAPGETMIMEHESMTSADRYVSKVESEITQALHRFLEPYGDAGKAVKIHLLHGDAVHAIARCVEDEKIDLLVMGTVARSGIPGYLMGNTAEKVLGQVACSVVALKPDRFETPVSL